MSSDVRCGERLLVAGATGRREISASRGLTQAGWPHHRTALSSQPTRAESLSQGPADRAKEADTLEDISGIRGVDTSEDQLSKGAGRWESNIGSPGAAGRTSHLPSKQTTDGVRVSGGGVQASGTEQTYVLNVHGMCRLLIISVDFTWGFKNCLPWISI